MNAKNLLQLLVAAAMLAAIAMLLIPVPTTEAAPDPSTKTVVIACKPGWRGSAVGQYGGVAFGVSCTNGRGTQKIRGVAGTAYSVRMGVESDAVAVDCAFTGDAAEVNEACVEVGLSIR